MDVGVIGGFKTKLQLYTVPGQVFYNSTRKLVLKGVDGIVFVADSQVPMLDANKESLQNLEANLKELGLDLRDIPMVFQWNKRDLKNIVPVEDLERELNPSGHAQLPEQCPGGHRRLRDPARHHQAGPDPHQDPSLRRDEPRPGRETHRLRREPAPAAPRRARSAAATRACRPAKPLTLFRSALRERHAGGCPAAAHPVIRKMPSPLHIPTPTALARPAPRLPCSPR